ncbi:MAG: tetratricopeptide repeat protein [Prevotella sp.]|nr:tetratricopeptide repeat protein [Prevotella sp.]
MKNCIIAFILSLCFSTMAKAQSNQEWRDSLSILIQQIDRHPNDMDLRFRKAAVNLLLEQWNYAVDEYTFILKKGENATAFFYRAYAYTQLGNYGFARSDYESLLRMQPTHFEGLLGLALLNDRDHHPTEAMDIMNRLVEMYPDNAVAYAARAGMEKDRNLYDVAEYDFSEAIRLDPAEAQYYLNRAIIRITLGKKSLAKEDLDQAVALGVSRAELSELYSLVKERN